MNIDIPYLYVLYFLLLFLYFYRNNKEGKYKLVLVVIGVYLFSAIAGVVLYNSKNSYFSNLTLLPALFYFALFYIAIIPLKKCDVSQIARFEINDKFVRYLCIFLLLTSLLPFLESVLKIRSFFAMADVGEYMTEMHNDRQTGEQKQTVVLSTVSTQLLRFSLWFSELIPILLFYLIVKYKKINVYSAGLLISQVLVLLNSMLNGGRSAFAYLIIYYVFVYFLFSSQFSASAKKRIQRVFFVIGGIAATFLLLITVWRFQSKKSDRTDTSQAIVEWMAVYAGEGMLNFNEYVWNMKAETEGDRTVPYFKSLLGMHTFEENFQRREYWENKTEIPEFIFYTTIGNFVQDFGLFFGALVVLVTSRLVSRVAVKNKLRKVYNIFIIALYYRILSLGIFFFPYGGFNGGKTLLKIFIIILVMYIIDKNVKNRYVVHPENI